MRHLASAVIALSILGCASAHDSQPESLNKQTSADTAGGPGRYLVIFKSDTLPSDASARVAKAGGSVFRALPEIGVASVAAGPTFAADMAKDSSVLAVGPERLNGVPNVRVTEVSDTEVG